MLSFSKTVLQIQALYPGFDISLRYLAVEHPPIFNLCSRYDFLHTLVCLAKTTAAGCRKKNNSLACKIIAFKESINDARFTIPPYRELKCSQFPSCVDFTGFNCIQKHRLTRAHREKQLKMSCQALHNAPPNRT